MAIDGLCLYYIVEDMAKELVGGKIDKIMQPSKDTIIISIRNNAINHRLLISANASYARIHITEQKYENPEQAPMLCMLFRKHLTGSRVLAIKQFDFDRIIHISFESINELGDMVEKTLIVEIMGKHSNIILLNENSVIIDAIHHVNHDMSRVRQIQAGLLYENPPVQNKLNPLTMSALDLETALLHTNNKLHKALSENIKGLSTTSAKEIALRTAGDVEAYLNELNKNQLSLAIKDFFNNLNELREANIIYDYMENPEDFFPFIYKQFNGSKIIVQKSLSTAMDNFYTDRDIRYKMRQIGANLSRTISNLIDRCENRLNIIQQSISDSDKADEYKLYGEIISSSFHEIKDDIRGKDFILLTNYYSPDCEKITVPLNPLYSPKENAKAYFKKYKKLKTAQELAVEQKEQAIRDRMFLEGALMDLENCKSSNEIAEIKLSLVEAGFIKREKTEKNKKIPSSHAMKFTSPDEISIIVGKNSLQNDSITSKAKAEEIWLHIQGMPGSHVIIKQENNIPDSTLMFAAKLAAYFSTGRKYPTVTIDYTQKKHVKKPAGAPAGFVIYKNFKSIIISLSDEDKIKFQQ